MVHFMGLGPALDLIPSGGTTRFCIVGFSALPQRPFFRQTHSIKPAMLTAAAGNKLTNGLTSRERI